MHLELWKINEHEGLAAVRKVAESHPPLGHVRDVSYLTPGTYMLCDASGNRLKITVEDARDKEGGTEQWGGGMLGVPAAGCAEGGDYGSGGG